MTPSLSVLDASHNEISEINGTELAQLLSLSVPFHYFRHVKIHEVNCLLLFHAS